MEANWHAAMRQRKRKVLEKSTSMGEMMDKLDQTQARIRAKVEHPFCVIKQQFGHAKVLHRWLTKDTARPTMLFALSNLWMVRNDY